MRHFFIELRDKEPFVYYFGNKNIIWNNLLDHSRIGVLISNGKVSLPVWKLTLTDGNLVRYSGNDTFEFINDRNISTFSLAILDTEIIRPLISYDGVEWEYLVGTITFSNGSAEKSWSDGQYRILNKD